MNKKQNRGPVLLGLCAALVLVTTLTSAWLAYRLWLKPIETIALVAPPDPVVVFNTPGGLLEVAAIQTTESIERKSLRSLVGVDLGTTVSLIRVPVTYRYQTALGKQWRAYMRDGKFLVIAPAVKVSVPVAIDTSKMQMQTKSGWARFDGQDNLKALLLEITPLLNDRARSSSFIELQRAQARKTVAQFARKWLITQERWKTVRPDQVMVYFSDEPIERLRSFAPEFAGSM